MQGLSVLCHEFGHMLGLPDLYARPENPGMEWAGGLVQHVGAAEPGLIPQHFGAWVKEKVGWLKPAVIDPTVKQKLVLAPDREFARRSVSRSSHPPRRVGVHPAREPQEEGVRPEPAGRRPADLARHPGNRPILKESHCGIEGPSVRPGSSLNEVPYPSGPAQ